jgi:heme oxygenase (biliverdin-producing, ferredoxin)
LIAEIIRNASRPQHKEAENSSFIMDLMQGKLNLEAYAKYLTNLAWLYESLEAKVRSGSAFTSSEDIWDEKLVRLDAITQDLEALGVHDWKNTTSPSTAMTSYIEHINSLEGKSDFRLVAHHYTRYLGDLSGGQAIAALVGRHYGATSDQLNFYRFQQIDDIVRYKDSYRAALDSLEISSEQIEELVKEVQLAFAFNQKVFEDLAR